jgi:hypothetical protein
MINGNRTKSDRKRHPRDYYITPEGLASNALWEFRFDEELAYPPDTILDAGCGNGVWALEALSSLAFAYDEDTDYPLLDAIDIEVKIPDYRKHLFYNVYEEDFLTKDFSKKYDMIIGNPPYSLAEEFVKKSFDILEDGAYVYFLLRLAFLEGIDRGKNFWSKYPLRKLYVCSRRPSFFSVNGKHTTDTLAYAMFLWKKGNEYEPKIGWLDWDYNDKI